MTDASWGLAQFARAGSPAVHTGILMDAVLREAPAEIGNVPVLELLTQWERYCQVLQGLDPEAGALVTDAQLLAPVTYPPKLLCAGANYYAHADEMGTAPPNPADVPFFFLKPPTTTICGPGATVGYPGSPADPQLDWEAELAVVIARRAKNIRAVDAAHYIGGYTAANDLSARGGFARPNAVMEPFAYDWLIHKGQDGFCPLGPALVPVWLIPDPQDLRISLAVNGATKQKSSTSDMVVGAYELVAAASHLMTLEPGDIILTGTPAGVGLPRDEFLHPGDEVTVHIECIGDLMTTIGARLPT